MCSTVSFETGWWPVKHPRDCCTCIIRAGRCDCFHIIVPPAENCDVTECYSCASFAFFPQPHDFCHGAQLSCNFGSFWAVFSPQNNFYNIFICYSRSFSFFTYFYFSYLSKVLTNILHLKMCKIVCNFGATFLNFCTTFATNLLQLFKFFSATFLGTNITLSQKQLTQSFCCNSVKH